MKISIEKINLRFGGDGLHIDEIKIDVQTDRSRPASVSFGVPHLLSPETGESVLMAVIIPIDAIGAIPLIFKDIDGNILAGGLTNVSVTVADPTVYDAAITSDGQWVQITPLKLGTSSLTYIDTGDNLQALLEDVTIGVPEPASVAFNEGGMVLSANPNPPAFTAPGSTVSGAGGGSTVSGAGGTSTVGGVTGGSTVNGAGGGSTVSGAGGISVTGAGGAPAVGAYTLSPVGVTPNPVTGRNVNPVTGNDINPATGLDISSTTGLDIPTAVPAAAARRAP